MHNNANVDSTKLTQAKIQEFVEEKGYALTITKGQRRACSKNIPEDAGHGGIEIFIGHLPFDMFEDEILPLMESVGRIVDLRIMMNPVSGFSRGYCFVTFQDKVEGEKAIAKYNDYEVRPGKKLRVNKSLSNVRLFVANIPTSESRERIKEEFLKYTKGLKDVIVYTSADDSRKKNRGFAFLEYGSHKEASDARRSLAYQHYLPFNRNIIVDWADPLEEPGPDIMSKVKVLYVRNITSDVSEEEIQKIFSAYGTVDRVKKEKNYAFVHFEEREAAMKAMEATNKTKLGKNLIGVTLAKPPMEKRQRDNQWKARELRRRKMAQELRTSYPAPAGMHLPWQYGIYSDVRSINSYSDAVPLSSRVENVGSTFRTQRNQEPLVRDGRMNLGHPYLIGAVGLPAALQQLHPSASLSGPITVPYPDYAISNSVSNFSTPTTVNNLQLGYYPEQQSDFYNAHGVFPYYNHSSPAFQ